MKNKIKNSAVIFAILIAAIFTSSCATERFGREMRTVSVIGTGVVSIKPDQATIVMSVRTSNADLQTAVQDNAKKMNSVQQAVLSVGLSKDDISTQNYNIHREYTWENNRQIFGNYRVSNEILVTVSDIEKAGTLIDTAVKAGANEFSSLNFGVSDTTGAVEQARILAMEKAEKAAKILATTGGASIGKIVSIQEDYVPYNDSARMLNDGMLMSAKAAGPTPINAGNTDISVTVHVTYALQ
ncbi:SIMPL domain-containing protein [Treponema parvum]|uniref:SIMPL domain-containing protein n=1 Tax=Treponema parvum TaxID=138851 RepID=A0A975EZQ6_9SPIR|nr:SIMPL domain-containing protein [Treponema parvum]QTQ11394.1 SIMPL domain-containing protein [Treponema parvum]